MFSKLLCKRQWDSTWSGLPREIRLLILKALIQDGCTLARLATVSREWQTDLERYNFARIKLTPSRLVNFSSIIHRNRALVRYIWFCLELDDYDCTGCAPDHKMLTDEEWEEVFAISNTNNGSITAVFQNLFSVLSTWDPNSELILDISIYSPSDAKHWFRYLTFVPDTISDMLGGSGIKQTILDKVYDDPQHGWVAGFRHFAPPTAAVRKVFHSVMGEGLFDSEQPERQWWDQLPPVPAATSLLLQQQNRRKWKPGSLAHMFARFPRLREVHYEPWREWDCMQSYTDRNFLYLFNSIPRLNTNLKRPVRFMLGKDLSKCESIRIPSPAIGRMVALASLELEHLAASFIWPNLTSLVITSKLLAPNENSVKIGSMLQTAAAAAMKMPQLETMEIWKGQKGLAALFKYHAFRNIQQAIITWRGTCSGGREDRIVLNEL
ncbi:hypothetical protein F4803DRAFT_568517 [Xylaria telfairii]|nr:hypothetical protein F4803DRAFT_568517 [Xylaria telfairii]